jgi:twitching motility protein PilT
MTLEELLSEASQEHASDLLIMIGDAPAMRVAGEWRRFPLPPVNPQSMAAYLSGIADQTTHDTLAKNREVDFSRNITGIGRIRCNLHYQRDHLALVIRIVWPKIPSAKSLGLPEHVLQAADAPHGLILVSGPTGSGKSTTLAAMVEHVNRTRAAHIITIEDPIEFIYKNDKAIIEQREIGTDTHSWSNALRNVLRQAPDVIVLGELRDLDSIAIALLAAETGHLVMASVHSSTAHGAISRMIDVFPASQIAQVRMQLAQSMKMVFAQRLLPGRKPNSRVLTYEVLVGTSAVQNLIRLNEIEQIPNMISAGREHGMVSFAQSQRELAALNLIDWQPEKLTRAN